MMKMWIKKTVHNLVSKFKTNDPFELANYKNIHVILFNLHEEIQGFYKYDRRNKYIIINSNLDEPAKKFVCAHELGHSQLHSRINTPFLRKNTLFSTDRIETEANRFAVSLLLYDKDLQCYETKCSCLRENGIPLEMERFLK